MGEEKSRSEDFITPLPYYKLQIDKAKCCLGKKNPYRNPIHYNKADGIWETPVSSQGFIKERIETP